MVVLNNQQMLQQVKLGQAFIPVQPYRNLFPVEEALFRGTIFADLYSPYQRPNPKHTRGGRRYG